MHIIGVPMAYWWSHACGFFFWEILKKSVGRSKKHEMKLIGHPLSVTCSEFGLRAQLPLEGL